MATMKNKLMSLSNILCTTVKIIYMTKKWPLYTGLTLLALGIVLKAATNINVFPLLIILTGVSFKAFYITLKVVRKEYKPGFELVTLICGLTIFLSGIALSNTGHINHFAAVLFKITGIALKATFVAIFIFKTRKPIPAASPLVVNE
jgi:hypothetical protein